MSRNPPRAPGATSVLVAVVSAALATLLAPAALATVRVAAQQPPGPVHDAAEIRRTADQILADGRYEPEQRSISERASDWLGDRVGDLFDALGGSGSGTGTLIAWTLILAAAAVILALVARTSGRPAPGAGTPTSSESMVELSRRPDEWRVEADQLEAEGRWVEGLRCRYRALVGELVGRGAIADVPGRTTGEHVRDVRRVVPAAAGPFAAATELFEAAWYGGATTGPDEAERFAQLEDATLAVGARR